MKLDIQELERGINESLEKEGFLNSIPGMKGLKALNAGVDYVVGGGLMDDIGNLAPAALPFLGMMGGKSGGGAAAPQSININLGQSAPSLGTGSGAVRTFGQMSQGSMGSGTPNVKVSGLLDLGLLRTVLTARTANEMIDTVQQDKNNPLPQQTQPIIPQEANKAKVELVSKYPEIEKMLADPQSRAYLESLLTKDTGYGS